MNTIGFDIDGVLYPWHKMLHLWLQVNRNITESYDDYWANVQEKDGDWSSSIYWSNMAGMRHIYEMYMPPQEDVDVLRRLSKDYNILYITHRGSDLERITRNWLDRYKFPNTDQLYVGNIPKSLSVRFYGCDYYVEDKQGIIESLIGVTDVICMKHNWNEEMWDLVPTIESLQDLEAVLK